MGRFIAARMSRTRGSLGGLARDLLPLGPLHGGGLSYAVMALAPCRWFTYNKGLAFDPVVFLYPILGDGLGLSGHPHRFLAVF